MNEALLLVTPATAEGLRGVERELMNSQGTPGTVPLVIEQNAADDLAENDIAMEPP